SRQPAWEAGTLPTELHPHTLILPASSNDGETFLSIANKSLQYHHDDICPELLKPCRQNHHNA
ncbi:MAG: hypothetical protein ACPH9W_15625, partial [Pseudomonadales bacterium]